MIVGTLKIWVHLNESIDNRALDHGHNIEKFFLCDRVCRFWNGKLCCISGFLCPGGGLLSQLQLTLDLAFLVVEFLLLELLLCFNVLLF